MSYTYKIIPLNLWGGNEIKVSQDTNNAFRLVYLVGKDVRYIRHNATCT